MRERFKINDYVVYNGDGTTLEQKRRNKAYAKIIEIIKIDNIEHYGLQLLGLNEKLSCQSNKIIEIDISEEYLKILNFTLQISEIGIKCYHRNSICISKTGFIIPISKYDKYGFSSGFCLADLRNISMKKLNEYVVDNKIDVNKFYKAFPRIYNINNLFDNIEIKECCTVDREKIITSILLI